MVSVNAVRQVLLTHTISTIYKTPMLGRRGKYGKTLHTINEIGQSGPKNTFLYLRILTPSQAGRDDNHVLGMRILRGFHGLNYAQIVLAIHAIRKSVLEMYGMGCTNGISKVGAEIDSTRTLSTVTVVKRASGEPKAGIATGPPVRGEGRPHNSTIMPKKGFTKRKVMN